MPNFSYKAVNNEGQTVEGVLLAPSADDVKRQLKDMKMLVINIKEVKSKKKTNAFKIHVKEDIIIHFTKQLYTLLKAGVPIVSGLKALKEQSKDENFAEVVDTIMQDIEGGSKLSDSLAQFPKIFPAIYINSVKVGELSGTLEETLLYLYKYLEDDAQMKREVKKAFRYPMFVFLGLIGAFIVFTTTVIPNFLPLFKQSDKELPLPTRILIEIHDIIANYGILIVIVAALLIAAFIYYIRTPRGRFQFDYYLLKLPIVGEFVKKVNIARFTRLFYTMNRTGISISKAFEIMQDTMGNKVFGKELKRITDKISKGEEISSAIGDSPYFTSLLIEMVSIGEKSGSLDDMLASVSEYYHREVGETVANLTSLIEPIVTVVLGGMILLLALAMFLPMWDMLSAF